MLKKNIKKKEILMLKKNISKNAVKNGRYEWSQPTYLVDKNDKRYESFK